MRILKPIVDHRNNNARTQIILPDRRDIGIFPGHREGLRTIVRQMPLLREQRIIRERSSSELPSDQRIGQFKWLSQAEMLLGLHIAESLLEPHQESIFNQRRGF